MQDSETTEKSQDTGHKLELGNATTALVDAFASGDAALIRKAAADHATALNSQATAMAASIAAPLYSQLEEIKKLFNEQIKQGEGKAREDRQAAFAQQQITRTWLDAEQERRDTQWDRLPAIVQGAMAAELEKIIPRIEGLEAGVEALAGIVSDQGERVDAIDSRLIAVEATPGTSPDLSAKIAYLSTRITIVGYAVGLLVLVWVLVLLATVLQ
jgi:hypothetical protein